ncbi:MAG: hypothetical protein QNK23_11300 [Crocinitomicaceae bacterium]|nr:hypothetical protein [Crocinitomicaceae bacterium]
MKDSITVFPRLLVILLFLISTNSAISQRIIGEWTFHHINARGYVMCGGCPAVDLFHFNKDGTFSSLRSRREVNNEIIYSDPPIEVKGKYKVRFRKLYCYEIEEIGTNVELPDEVYPIKYYKDYPDYLFLEVVWDDRGLGPEEYPTSLAYKKVLE